MAALSSGIGGAFSISLDIISGNTPFQISSWSPSELELEEPLWRSSLVLFRSPYSLSLSEYVALDSGKSVGYVEEKNNIISPEGTIHV